MLLLRLGAVIIPSATSSSKDLPSALGQARDARWHGAAPAQLGFLFPFALPRAILTGTYFAVLYKQNPKGLPSTKYKVDDRKVAAAIQNAVWEVVSTEDLAGVK